MTDDRSATAATEKKPRTIKARLWRLWLDWGRPFLVVAVVLTTLRSSLADWNDVPSGSMNPTILEGDRIFVNKLAYDLKVPFTTWHVAEWGDPERGDIVVFYAPDTGVRMVKRVVGLPGDTVELRSNVLLINGEPMPYSPPDQAAVDAIVADQRPFHEFATEALAGVDHAVMLTPRLRSARTFGPVTVPAGEYFMLGDNRDNSRDSRYFGFVPRAAIVGQAKAVAVSVDPRRHYWPRWQRFFTGLD